MKQGKIPPLLVRKRRSNSRKTWLQKAGPKRKQGKRKNEPTGGHGGNDSLRSFASSGTSRLPPPFSICLSPSPAVPERTGEVAWVVSWSRCRVVVSASPGLRTGEERERDRPTAAECREGPPTGAACCRVRLCERAEATRFWPSGLLDGYDAVRIACTITSLPLWLWPSLLTGCEKKNTVSWLKISD
jgi:hypothetical protein